MNKKSTVVIISLSMLMSLSAMAARPSVSKNAANIETLKTQTGQLESDLSNIALTPGPQGEIGEAGAKGDAGASGATGAAGVKGDAGASGGMTGATGATGLTGLTGATGQNGADGVMYDGAFEGDMQYWNGNAWMMITAPAENADSLSFCDGQPTWTQGGCIVVYEVGDTGPAGGIVFYVSNEGLNGLEAAPVDQGSAEWGCYGGTVPGTFSMAVGAGQANTDLILNHSCGITPDKGNAPHAAAIMTQDYSLGGYSDWFLPSSDELDLMYVNLHYIDRGRFDDVYYWSSTQSTSKYSYIQNFRDGDIRRLSKAVNTLSVRAVRAF